MKTIETENGECWELTDYACRMLSEARDARTADVVFEGFAEHIPARARLAVWMVL